MRYKGTLIVVKDCNRALKFYRDMFGFQLLQDNDGNMELTNNLYLQESGYWKQFTKRSIISNFTRYQFPLARLGKTQKFDNIHFGQGFKEIGTFALQVGMQN